MALEEQHFTSVEVLLDRYRATLSQLCEIFAALEPRFHEATAQDSLKKTLKVLQSSNVTALKARIGFYIQTLQMSL